MARITELREWGEVAISIRNCDGRRACDLGLEVQQECTIGF